MKVLIAGLAGASLGTEIIKCLSDAGVYEIYGCDISELAYGLYSSKLKKSFIVDREDYVVSVTEICKKNGIQYIVPGGEQPMVLLSASESHFSASSIKLVCNTREIVDLFSDKKKTFEFLGKILAFHSYTYSTATGFGILRKFGDIVSF